jgi:hypothetical protein
MSEGSAGKRSWRFDPLSSVVSATMEGVTRSAPLGEHDFDALFRDHAATG